ncbi:hypothetical protein [Actinoalloteichus fjordicus]|nr:hypothetical protein [Actinoalloteichus fjordicus]
MSPQRACHRPVRQAQQHAARVLPARAESGTEPAVTIAREIG